MGLWETCNPMTPRPTQPVKVSFSFYPADITALNDLTVALRRLGAPVRRGTVLRALIALNSEAALGAAASLLHEFYVAKIGAREAEYYIGAPTVDLPPADVEKLDRVVTELLAKQIPATRAFVVRATLRAAPKPEILAPSVKKFLAEFPRRPRTVVKKPAKHGRR